MWNFLKEVHEFKRGNLTRAVWAKSLDMSPVLTEPENASFDEIVKVVRDRDQQIRNEVIDFINGKLERKDV